MTTDMPLTRIRVQVNRHEPKATCSYVQNGNFITRMDKSYLDAKRWRPSCSRFEKAVDQLVSMSWLHRISWRESRVIVCNDRLGTTS